MFKGTYRGLVNDVDLQTLEITSDNHNTKTIEGRLIEGSQAFDVSGRYQLQNDTGPACLLEFSIKSPQDFAASWVLLNTDGTGQMLKGYFSRVNSFDSSSDYSIVFTKIG
jgi:hypothetical protein